MVILDVDVMDSDLSAFQLRMMFVISGCSKPKGLAIKSGLEQELGEGVNHGRLYPNLDTLVEKGYVEKGELDRRTNYYEMTEQGENLLSAFQYWCDQQRHEDTLSHLN